MRNCRVCVCVVCVCVYRHAASMYDSCSMCEYAMVCNVCTVCANIRCGPGGGGGVVLRVTPERIRASCKGSLSGAQAGK